MLRLMLFVLFMLPFMQPESTEPTPDPLFTFDYFDADAQGTGAMFHGATWHPDSDSFVLFSGMRLLVVDGMTGDIRIDVDHGLVDFPWQVRWSDDRTRLFVRFDVLDLSSGTWRDEQAPPEAAWWITDYERPQHAIRFAGETYAEVSLDFQPYENGVAAAPDGEQFLVYNDTQWALVRRDGGIIAQGSAPQTDESTGVGGGCGGTHEVGAAWRPDSEAVAVYGFGETQILNSRTGSVRTQLPVSGAADWHPSGTRLVLADPNAGVYDAGDGQQQVTLENDGGYSMRFAFFSPDGRHVITRDSVNQVEVWDVATESRLLQVRHTGADSRFCANIPVPPAVSPDSTRLLTWHEIPPPLIVGQPARVFVEDDGLKLRSGPGTTFDEIATMPSQTIVEITGEPFDDGTYVWWPLRIARSSDDTIIELQGYAVEMADGIRTLNSLESNGPIRVSVWQLP